MTTTAFECQTFSNFYTFKFNSNNENIVNNVNAYINLVTQTFNLRAKECKIRNGPYFSVQISDLSSSSSSSSLKFSSISLLQKEAFKIQHQNMPVIKYNLIKITTFT